MRMRASRRLIAALAVLALFAAACGDDDTTTDVADTDTDHDHDGDPDHVDDEMADMDTDHDHGEAVEFTGENVPTVAVDVEADPAGGINVHVTTTDYTVNAAAASTEHIEGEGHFHLSIDGEKALRFYNHSIHYAGVVEGEVEVAVELSANDHRAYAANGEPLVATAMFTVPEHSHDSHSHADPVAVEWDGDAVSLDLVVEVDPKSGWNAFATVDGMTLSAENVNGDHVPGEGHLHIYANGQKLGRLYGPATHIGALPDGDVEISIAAYTNDHMPYEIDGEPLATAVTVTVAS